MTSFFTLEMPDKVVFVPATLILLKPNNWQVTVLFLYRTTWRATCIEFRHWCDNQAPRHRLRAFAPPPPRL